jgi:hypothetical protein
MALKVICAVLGVVAFNNLDSVTTLECYSCTASLGNNFRCENLSYSGGSLPYYTCMYGDAVCAKYIIEYGDSLMIHRSCQHRDICAILASKYNNYYSKLLDCQTCSDHNYCNTSNLLKFSPLVAIILFTITKLLIN